MAEHRNKSRGVLRVLFSCSGIGIMNRGIETFFQDAFNGLKNTEGLNLRLLKGAGVQGSEERVVWNLPRTGWAAALLGALARRNAYAVEQWSSFPAVARQILAFQPHLVFYSDANLGFLLYWLRNRAGVHFNLLFSNGGPVHAPFVRTDYVQQVTPFHYDEALQAGEPPGKHFMVPYGINLIPFPDPPSLQERIALRHRLGLPLDRKIVLSVGWIRRVHKRMDYVIEEIAHLPPPRPFLQLLGAIDRGSAEVIALGKKLLGEDGFAAHSVAGKDVFNYYRAADCFVLASLQEGFGRVYLEALMHGLPVIAHRNPVTEYVLGANATLADLGQPRGLAPLLAVELKQPPCPALMRERWASVRDRFSWGLLAPRYRDMFEACSCPKNHPHPSGLFSPRTVVLRQQKGLRRTV
jgi:glycosyltransferase involved in cell wall biosynthesis